jgi:transposase
MRAIREVLRLYFVLRLSGRAIARSVGASPATVSGYLARAKLEGLSWPLPPELEGDEALERLLFPEPRPAIERRDEPDWAQVCLELRRGKHVTKQLLWQEYREAHPNGLGYSQFCERATAWSKRLSVTMRQVHAAGEKLFVDFSGDSIAVFDPEANELRRAKLFIAVMGASNLTYVEPVFSEDLPTWIGCHVRALEYFKGVPQIVVPDNLKSGVTRPDLYDPAINGTYAELGRHYEVAIIPARIKKPRDKAKVEQGVLLAERWILAALRHRHFGSLQALKEAIAPLLEKLNDRKMRRLGKSRREIFEQIEQRALRPLPSSPFVLVDWKRTRLGPDYHVEYERHFYSAPHVLSGEEVELRVTESAVEILHHNQRVASHQRSRIEGGQTTLPEHLPRHHREMLAWTPEVILERAKAIGSHTQELVKKIFETRAHREQGRRSALGLIHLADEYPAERLERACRRAAAARLYSRQNVLLILKKNLDRIEEDDDPAPPPLATHGNLRGSDYYH